MMANAEMPVTPMMRPNMEAAVAVAAETMMPSMTETMAAVVTTAMMTTAVVTAAVMTAAVAMLSTDRTGRHE